jgi:hypothetical protein
MPDWESELSELLGALDVLPEQAPLLDEQVSVDQIRPTGRGSAPRPDIDERELPPLSGQSGDSLPFDGDEVSAVRREMEATLARVAYLARIGRLDRSLRDDVVFVLQALTRPHPTALAASERQEWHLGNAAAVLHFCRVVMRLTPPAEL